VAANNDTTATGHCRKGSGAGTIILPPHKTLIVQGVNNYVYLRTPCPFVRTDIAVVGDCSVISNTDTETGTCVFLL
jgi:hypothetical protein